MYNSIFTFPIAILPANADKSCNLFVHGGLEFCRVFYYGIFGQILHKAHNISVHRAHNLTGAVELFCKLLLKSHTHLKNKTS